MIDWGIAFVITCVLEVIVVVLVLRRRCIGTVLAAQVATHPLVWLMMATLPFAGGTRLAIVEGFAILVEAYIYRRRLGLSLSDACALSALANTTSFVVGAWIVHAL